MIPAEITSVTGNCLSKFSPKDRKLVYIAG